MVLREGVLIEGLSLINGRFTQPQKIDLVLLFLLRLLRKRYVRLCTTLTREASEV